MLENSSCSRQSRSQVTKNECFIFVYFNSTSHRAIILSMLEARNFVPNLDEAKRALKENNADYKGEYFIKDIIFIIAGFFLFISTLDLRKKAVLGFISTV